MSVYTPKEKEDMSASCLVLEKQFNNIIFTIFLLWVVEYKFTQQLICGELNGANFIQ